MVKQPSDGETEVRAGRTILPLPAIARVVDRLPCLRLFALICAFVAACGSATPPPPSHGALRALLAETKFQPTACYRGADRPEDQAPLEVAVNNAIRDIAAMPAPVESGAVRARLERLVADVDSFATADRDQAYQYAIRIWRAVGLHEETHLFARDDASVLRLGC